ncbi:MAG: amino acid ABC transporter permease [Bacilli bacterium]|nr:amino acid ABC transporter permease [Bacilli bacterium]
MEMIRNVIHIIFKYFPLLLKGLGVTLELSAITVFFGAFIGMFVCLLVKSPSKVLSFLGKTYVEVIRGVPLLLQLCAIYLIFASTIGKFAATAVALILNSGAYVAEIMRAGIQAVDKGQTEAARSLGLSKTQTMIKVILPQAIRNILPAIGNEYVTIIKETSLAMTFFVGDLMTVQKEIGSVTYLYLEAYVAVALFYFVSTFTLSKLILAVERRMKRSVGYS